jgi:hypothetical protein
MVYCKLSIYGNQLEMYKHFESLTQTSKKCFARRPPEILELGSKVNRALQSRVFKKSFFTTQQLQTTRV